MYTVMNAISFSYRSRDMADLTVHQDSECNINTRDKLCCAELAKALMEYDDIHRMDLPALICVHGECDKYRRGLLHAFVVNTHSHEDINILPEPKHVHDACTKIDYEFHLGVEQTMTHYTTIYDYVCTVKKLLSDHRISCTTLVMERSIAYYVSIMTRYISRITNSQLSRSLRVILAHIIETMNYENIILFVNGVDKNEDYVGNVTQEYYTYNFLASALKLRYGNTFIAIVPVPNGTESQTLRGTARCIDSKMLPHTDDGTDDEDGLPTISKWRDVLRTKYHLWLEYKLQLRMGRTVEDGSVRNRYAISPAGKRYILSERMIHVHNCVNDSMSHDELSWWGPANLTPTGDHVTTFKKLPVSLELDRMGVCNIFCTVYKKLIDPAGNIVIDSSPLHNLKVFDNGKEGGNKESRSHASNNRFGLSVKRRHHSYPTANKFVTNVQYPLMEGLSNQLAVMEAAKQASITSRLKKKRRM